MKKQYIKASNEAPNLSLGTAVLYFLAFRYFHAPQWVYGAAGLFYLIIVITYIVRMFTEDGVDVVKR